MATNINEIEFKGYKILNCGEDTVYVKTYPDPALEVIPANRDLYGAYIQALNKRVVAEAEDEACEEYVPQPGDPSFTDMVNTTMQARASQIVNGVTANNAYLRKLQRIQAERAQVHAKIHGIDWAPISDIMRGSTLITKRAPSFEVAEALRLLSKASLDDEWTREDVPAPDGEISVWRFTKSLWNDTLCFTLTVKEIIEAGMDTDSIDKLLLEKAEAAIVEWESRQEKRW